MLIFINYFNAIAQKKNANKIVNKPANSVILNANNSIIANEGELCGAEIYYSSGNEKEITIYLTKYYRCGNFILDSFETVTVQETTSTTLTGKPILKLTSVSDSNLFVNARCNGLKSNCIKKVTYSGKINVMKPMIGGYYVTWGYCCWNQNSLTNIEGMMESQKQGLALTLNIPDLPVEQSNSAPVFKYPPTVSLCKSQLVSINLSAYDADKDSLSFELSQVYNYKTQNEVTYAEEPKTFPGQPINKTFAGGRPPFKKIKYRKGFTSSNPLPKKQISIVHNSGSMEIKADTIGEFLIGVSVSEFRAQKKLGSYQRVFKININD
ncbi:MAG: hypothetical protein ACEQSR_01565 [Candidatus Methylacidiphilales bacterium]